MAMTTTGACETRLNNVSEVLEKYNISDEDMDTIKSAIIGPHFELVQACKAGRILEDMLNEAYEQLDKDTKDIFIEFMKRNSKLDKDEKRFCEKFASETMEDMDEYESDEND